MASQALRDTKASMDHSLTIIDTVDPLRNHHHGITQVACHPSSDLVAVADVDMACEIRRGKEIAAWFDLRSPEVKARSIQRVRNLFFSRNGKVLYAVAGERLLAIDFVTGAVLWHYTPSRTWAFLVSSPYDAAELGDGTLVVSSDNGTIAVLDAVSGQRLKQMRDDEAPRILFTKGGRLIGTDTFRMLAWDMATRSKVVRVPLPSRGLSMAMAPRDPFAAVRGLDAVYLLDTETGLIVAQIPVGVGLPRMRFHPHKRLLAIAEKHAVVVVDYRGRFVERFDMEGARVLSMAYTPGGEELLVGCSDRSLRRFESGYR